MRGSRVLMAVQLALAAAVAFAIFFWLRDEPGPAGSAGSAFRSSKCEWQGQVYSRGAMIRDGDRVLRCEDGEWKPETR